MPNSNENAPQPLGRHLLNVCKFATSLGIVRIDSQGFDEIAPGITEQMHRLRSAGGQRNLLLMFTGGCTLQACARLNNALKFRGSNSRATEQHCTASGY